LESIEFTLEEIQDMESSVNKLLSIKLPLRVAYQWAKISHKILQEIKFIEKSRTHLITTKYLKDGEKKIEDEKDVARFSKEFMDFLKDETTTIEFENKILLKDLEEYVLEPRYFISIMKFFKE
jgi:hypothetical protein